MNLKVALKIKTISQNKTNSTQQQSPNAPPVQTKTSDTTKTNTSNNPHKEKDTKWASCTYSSPLVRKVTNVFKKPT
jgi:hypothetical protein